MLFTEEEHKKFKEEVITQARKGMVKIEDVHTNCKVIFGSGSITGKCYDIIMLNESKKELKSKTLIKENKDGGAKGNRLLATTL